MIIKEIVNCTGKNILFVDNQNVEVSMEPRHKSSVRVKRSASTETIGDASVFDIKVNTTHCSVVSDLPIEKEGTIYIVSQLVFNAVSHSRKDVYILDEPRRERGKVLYFGAITRVVYTERKKELKEILQAIRGCSPKNDGVSADKLLIAIHRLKKIIHAKNTD